MSRYNVRIKKSAQKEIRKLPTHIINPTVQKIRLLGEDPRPEGCKKLKDRPSRWRIRIGDYRIVYQIYDRELVIEVVQVGNRRDIY